MTFEAQGQSVVYMDRSQVLRDIRTGCDCRLCVHHETVAGYVNRWVALHGRLGTGYKPSINVSLEPKAAPVVRDRLARG